MAGLTEFYCGWNEPSHASQFKWLEYTFNGFLIAPLTKACKWIKPICLQLHTKPTFSLHETVMTHTYTYTIIHSVFRLCYLDNPHNIMILLPHKTVLKNNNNIKHQTVLTSICCPSSLLRTRHLSFMFSIHPNSFLSRKGYLFSIPSSSYSIKYKKNIFCIL